MEQYQEQQQQNQQNQNQHTAKKASQQEQEYRTHLHLQKQKQDQEELQRLKSTMNPHKIQEMKQQAQLQSQMVHAYKTGDEQTRRKLQKRLEPPPPS
mmetsp:Transcript_8927/g.10677  ORF Transcript_8927/g.10677 Transcript_8927/m.10677 type:complete len:97 (+) Transcript_8927:1-291(+)